ncbi:hypothetical protein DUZ99_02475 [Xylanibacillus composti]|uniref:Hydrolase n=1 Tax=Xylanibacillus composti TaxID=1572762 RepID=A0A8J4H0L6_9BACL|nr:hypothetical protein [Xylanibacillus composti]MDT9723861.1 hypothetical protein [Xylanibacillus composti]GIQ67360.1 hypothetical protein XYCOK13_01840 [Xylanibacillus composti]
MDKRTYYVSVQAATILENQGDAAYEFEIEATPKEAAQLGELMEVQKDYDFESFFRAPIPGIPYHYDGPNDGYDTSMRQVFAKLHELGTAETKQHIEQMGILG